MSHHKAFVGVRDLTACNVPEALLLTFTSKLARQSLSPAARQKLKTLIDPVLSPIGSVAGASRPTNHVALTFDDGPDPDVTPRLLDLLQQRDVHATFFLLTEKSTQQTALTRKIAENGHELGLHFDRHDRLTQLPLTQVKSRLRQSRSQLEDLIGPVRFFRPPFGAQSFATFCLARAANLEVVIWGPYAEDWEEQSAESAAGKVLRTVRGGDIVLLHDGLEMPAGQRKPSFDRVRMVEIILDGLLERGLATQTVGALLKESGIRRSAWFRA